MEFISLSSQGAQLNTFNHPAAPRRSPWFGSFGGHCIPIHFFLVRLFLCGSLRSYWKPERMEANSACLWLGQARLSIIIMELTKILGAENNSGKDHIVQQPEPIPVHPERADLPTSLLLGKRVDIFNNIRKCAPCTVIQDLLNDPRQVPCFTRCKGPLFYQVYQKATYTFLKWHSNVNNHKLPFFFTRTENCV